MGRGIVRVNLKRMRVSIWWRTDTAGIFRCRSISIPPIPEILHRYAGVPPLLEGGHRTSPPSSYSNSPPLVDGGTNYPLSVDFLEESLEQHYGISSSGSSSSVGDHHYQDSNLFSSSGFGEDAGSSSPVLAAAVDYDIDGGSASYNQDDSAYLDGSSYFSTSHEAGGHQGGPLEDEYEYQFEHHHQLEQGGAQEDYYQDGGSVGQYAAYEEESAAPYGGHGYHGSSSAGEEVADGGAYGGAYGGAGEEVVDGAPPGGAVVPPPGEYSYQTGFDPANFDPVRDLFGANAAKDTKLSGGGLGQKRVRVSKWDK